MKTHLVCVCYIRGVYVIFVVCVCVCVCYIPGVCVFVIFLVFVCLLYSWCVCVFVIFLVCVCVCYIRGVYVIFVLCARVCVCVCVCVCARAYIHTRASEHSHTLMGEGVYVCMWGEECMHVCVCVYVWGGGGVYVCVCVCVCVSLSRDGGVCTLYNLLWWSGSIPLLWVGDKGGTYAVWVGACLRGGDEWLVCACLSQNHSLRVRYHNVYMQVCHSQQML